MEIGLMLAELKTCSSTKNFHRGQELHADAIQSGHISCIYVANSLVTMYAKCGSMHCARQVFDGINFPDVVSWNALILGYADNGDPATALNLFGRMKPAPTSVTFLAALKACGSLALEQDELGKAECRERGRQIHLQIGNHSNRYVKNSLVDMYSKCGSMSEAHQVFYEIKQPDEVAWNALISGYAENGEGEVALNLFAKMKSQGSEPTSKTYIAALKSCTSLAPKKAGLVHGMRIHAEIGGHTNIYVQSSLIDMYSKCGSTIGARQVFDAIEIPDVVSWNAMILGYADNGECVVALDLFARMKARGCAPNLITFAAALKACGLLGALESGSRIHAELDAAAQRNAMIITALIDFYARCGSMVEAQKVFDSFPRRTRNLRNWTALLTGYSRLGDSEAVFELFEEMQAAGYKPDGVAFLCVLTCCSHTGLVDKANECFRRISMAHATGPSPEHCNCMVDILGRSNKLDDAMALLQRVSHRADAVTWKSVLGACRKWKRVHLGTLAFQSLVSLDHADAAAYALMAQIYGSVGMWEEQESVLATKLSTYVS